MFALISKNYYVQVREMVDRYGLSFVPEWGNGYGLVYHALAHRSLGIAKMLISKGAEVNALFDVSSPLVLAVKIGDAEIIRMLLDKGAKVDMEYKEGFLKMPLFHLLLQNFERLDREVDLVERFLQDGADLNAVDSCGQTALFHAVNMHNKDLVERFLKRGAKANVQSKSRLTPIHVAVQKCSKEVVEMLLNAGAIVDCRAADGATPLHLACDRKNMDSLGIVELLISRGADVNLASDEGITALHAAAGGPSEVVELLLKEGADINAETADARTPLHCAVEVGCKKNVELLLDKGAAINATTLDLCTPLHYAVLHKPKNAGGFFAIRAEHTKIAEILLERGADVNAQTKNGKTCLLIAVEKSFADLIDVILGYKPDLSINEACLQAAIRRCEAHCSSYTVEKDRSPIVERLLAYGFRLRPQDVSGLPLVLFFSVVRNGSAKTAEAILDLSPNAQALLSSSFQDMTALHAAVQRRHLEIARLLLKCGADVNAVSGGKRPLDFAIDNADWRMFELLVSHQADVKYDRELLLRAAVSRVEIVAYLLQHGAYVNVRDRARNTPLHYSARGRSEYGAVRIGFSVEEAIKITTLLLRSGAKINVRNIFGTTPLMEAADRGSCELARLLLDHNADVNMRDTQGFGSALDRSVLRENYELCKLLLERGARINFRDERCTRPLHSAAFRGNLDLVKLLVEFGVDENTLSDCCMNWSRTQGVHALHVATRENRIPILEYLLESTDSSLNSCTSEGVFQYPIDVAFHFRAAYPETFLFLVRHVIRMKAAGLYVNHANSTHALRDIGPRTLNVGSRPVTIAEFTDICKAEVSAIQDLKIQNTPLSFHSILTASTKRLASLSKNEDLKKIVSSDSFLTEFPIYGSWIRGRLSIGERWRSWCDQCSEALRRILPSFPCDCIQYVLDYLSIEDMRMLILASQTGDREAYPPLRYRWYLRTRKIWVRSLWPKAATRNPTKRKVIKGKK